MSLHREQIRAAAEAALKLGKDDARKVVREFETSAPTSLAIPRAQSDNDYAFLAGLVRRFADALLVGPAEVTTDHPCVVALGQDEDYVTIGATGILISSNMVLTAAHCLDEGFGGGAWYHDDQQTPHFLEVSGDQEIHRKFGDPFDFANDVAILKLAAPAPVKIYSFADDRAIAAVAGYDLVGYGRNEVGEAGVKKTVWSSKFLPTDEGAVYDRAFEFLTGGPRVDDGDACWQDSGGPALITIADRNEHLLAGIISRPFANACGDGTVCELVSRHSRWIDATIQELGGQPRPLA